MFSGLMTDFAARLAEIKASIYDYNIKLYRACANANPHNMNNAMIGISKEVKGHVHAYGGCHYAKMISYADFFVCLHNYYIIYTNTGICLYMYSINVVTLILGYITQEFSMYIHMYVHLKFVF